MAGQVNGQSYQHALINLASVAPGAPPFGHRKFESIDFSDEGTKEPVYNAAGEIIGYVIKPRKTDGKIKMKMEEWGLWRDWMLAQTIALSAALQRPVGIGQVEFQMALSVGVNLASMRLRRLRVMVQSEPFSSTDDQNPLSVEIPLFVMDITDEAGNRFIQR